MQTMIRQVMERLKGLLRDGDLERLARESGWMRRRRKVNARAFLAILTLGALSKPEMTYTDMSQYAGLMGVAVSPQALHQRFTESAFRFLQAVLARVVQAVLERVAGQVVPLLARFNGVYIRDSSVIRLPAALAAIWPGCGDCHGATAGVKLQIRWEHSSGRLEGPVVQAARAHDRATPYGPENAPAGSLAIADLGYFCLAEIAERQRRGQYFLTKYKVGTTLWKGGKRWDLVAWLQRLEGTFGEVMVEVGARERIPVRLLAYRLPPEAAARRQRRVREYARKKQVTPRWETRFLASWVVVLTNVPADMLNAQEVAVLLRVRWQVEVLFRTWKSQLRVDTWRSQNPWRILCELYGKLIAIALTHWLVQLGWALRWDLSLAKAVQAVQKVAIPLMLALRSRHGFLEIIRLLLVVFWSACRQNKRRRRPATFQLLLQPGFA